MQTDRRALCPSLSLNSHLCYNRAGLEAQLHFSEVCEWTLPKLNQPHAKSWPVAVEVCQERAAEMRLGDNNTFESFLTCQMNPFPSIPRVSVGPGSGTKKLSHCLCSPLPFFKAGNLPILQQGKPRRVGSNCLSYKCAKSKMKQVKDFDNPWPWHTLTYFDDFSLSSLSSCWVE